MADPMAQLGGDLLKWLREYLINGGNPVPDKYIELNNLIAINDALPVASSKEAPTNAQETTISSGAPPVTSSDEAPTNAQEATGESSAPPVASSDKAPTNARETTGSSDAPSIQSLLISNLPSFIWEYNAYIHPGGPFKRMESAPTFNPARDNDLQIFEYSHIEAAFERAKLANILNGAQLTFLENYVSLRKDNSIEAKGIIEQLDCQFADNTRSLGDLDAISSSWTLRVVEIKSTSIRSNLARLNYLNKTTNSFLSTKEARKLRKVFEEMPEQDMQIISEDLNNFGNNLKVQVSIFTENVKYLTRSLKHAIVRSRIDNRTRFIWESFACVIALVALSLSFGWIFKKLTRLNYVFYWCVTLSPALIMTIMFLIPDIFYETLRYRIMFGRTSHLRHFIVSQNRQSENASRMVNGNKPYMMPLPIHTKSEVTKVKNKFSSDIASIRARFPTECEEAEVATLLTEAEENLRSVEDNSLLNSDYHLADLKDYKICLDNKKTTKLKEFEHRVIIKCCLVPLEKCMDFENKIATDSSINRNAQFKNALQSSFEPVVDHARKHNKMSVQFRKDLKRSCRYLRFRTDFLYTVFFCSLIGAILFGVALGCINSVKEPSNGWDSPLFKGFAITGLSLEAIAFLCAIWWGVVYAMARRSQQRIGFAMVVENILAYIPPNEA